MEVKKESKKTLLPVNVAMARYKELPEETKEIFESLAEAYAVKCIDDFMTNLTSAVQKEQKRLEDLIDAEIAKDTTDAGKLDKEESHE